MNTSIAKMTLRQDVAYDSMGSREDSPLVCNCLTCRLAIPSDRLGDVDGQCSRGLIPVS